MAFSIGGESRDYRLKLTSDKTLINQSYTDVPIWTTLERIPSGHDFWTHVKSDGGDLIVTKSDGSTRLYLEVDWIDTSNKRGSIHFKGDLSVLANTEFYLYYGNSGASQPAVDATYGRNGVWDANDELAVWHMSESSNGTTDEFVDSTGNGNDGVGVQDSGSTYPTRSYDTTAKAYVQSFSAYGEQEGNYINITGLASALNSIGASGGLYTVIARSKSAQQGGAGSSLPMIIEKRDYSSNERTISMGIYNGGANDSLAVYVEASGNFILISTSQFNDDNWHSCCEKRNSSGGSGEWELLLDGSSEDTDTWGTDPDSSGDGDRITIGCRTRDGGSIDECYDGEIFEIRIMDDAQSDNWVDDQHTISASNTSFWKTVGDEETSSLDISPTGIASAEAFGTFSVAPGAVSVTPTGIASGEAFGTPTITTGAVAVAPNGIVSGEAFGSFSIATGAVSVSPTGIPSAEAFGSFSITTGAVTVSPTGIPSAEAFGSFTVSPEQFITLTGISSAEAFGSFSLVPGAVSVSPSGIPSAEAFGSFSISIGAVSITPTGIVSGEAFGTFSVQPGAVAITPTGISSEEAFGAFSISVGAVSISPNGIVSAEAFGSFSITTGAVSITPTGIVSGEAFGSPTITPGAVTIIPAGIPSAEAFGAFEVIRAGIIIPDGIVSGEAFGSFSVQPGAVTIQPDGISSEEAFGAFAVLLQQFVSPNGIVSGEAFGSFSVSPGAVNVSPTGITSGEAFGAFTLVPGAVSVNPDGIVSAETFGTFSIAVGAVAISPNGVVSAESFGSFTISPGAVSVTPTGVLSGEAFGIFTVAVGNVNVAPDGIPSAEAFGALTIVPGAAGIALTGIPSAEAFGSFIVLREGVVIPAGISSAEAFGSFTVTVMLQFVSVDGISTGEAFGAFVVSHAAAPGQQSQFETDIEDVFLNDDDFAESVKIHYNREGTEDELTAIFDNEYFQADVDSNFEVQMRQPMLIIQTRKLRRKLVRGDWMEVRGVTYSVVTSEPDGTGVSVVTLQHKV
jgi:hypothetical protein